jgi:hypothetical protein
MFLIVSSVCQNDGCLCTNKATLKVEFEKNDCDRNNMYKMVFLEMGKMEINNW